MSTIHKPRILISCLSGEIFGGGEMHAFTLYKLLKNAGYHVTILVNAHTALHQRLVADGLPCHGINARWLQKKVRALFCWIVAHRMRTICTHEHIDLIHCNIREEVISAARATHNTSIKIVFTRHIPDDFDVRKIGKSHAVIGVTSPIATYIAEKNTAHNIGITYINAIAPFFDAERLTNFVPQETRESFFARNFNITLKQLPLLCVIGNMGTDPRHKSYHLLFEALRHLKDSDNIKIQAVLAGDGPMRQRFEQSVREQGLADYVYFLGSTNNIPGILYYSDFMVLPSIKEAQGLVYAEAGMMHKASIGAYDTGAEIILKHEETGLLFKNGDALDLALTIKRLIENPLFTQQLGMNAYTHITQNFAPHITFAQHEQLYAQLVQQHQP
ncbi:MAG: glycosyltransferase family 4 protein [Candidatus Babeliales bacterium]|jgi:glycosyltransferase involved in cell wall biosynthesis